MTHYYDNGHFDEAYPEVENKNILGEVLAAHGLKQFRCAETEKYAHVTFFFNSLRNEPFDGRRPRPGAEPQGGHLRPEAGDERV